MGFAIGFDLNVVTNGCGIWPSSLLSSSLGFGIGFDLTLINTIVEFEFQSVGLGILAD